VMVGNEVVDECGEDTWKALIVTVSSDDEVGRTTVLVNTSKQSKNYDEQ